MDPKFAFHKDVLINEDRFKNVDTPTTQARSVKMERLHVLAGQCQQQEILTPGYQYQTSLRLLEWAQSQSH